MFHFIFIYKIGMSISENKEFQKKKKEKKKREQGWRVLVRRKIIENIEKVKASWA